jgi:hypothetical protein
MPGCRSLQVTLPGRLLEPHKVSFSRAICSINAAIEEIEPRGPVETEADRRLADDLKN